MLVTVPGFAPAWEGAKSTALAEIQEEEAGKAPPKSVFSKIFGGVRPDTQEVSKSLPDSQPADLLINYKATDGFNREERKGRKENKRHCFFLATLPFLRLILDCSGQNYFFFQRRIAAFVHVDVIEESLNIRERFGNPLSPSFVSRRSVALVIPATFAHELEHHLDLSLHWACAPG